MQGSRCTRRHRRRALSFSDAFREGTAARDTLIGDVGTSAPSEWLPPFKDNDIHAVLAVAADSVAMLKWRLGNIRAGSLFSAGVIELGTVAGRTRQDLPNVKPSQVGHEHFGFKDGVSQPGIRGIDLPEIAIRETLSRRHLPRQRTVPTSSSVDWPSTCPSSTSTSMY